MLPTYSPDALRDLLRRHGLTGAKAGQLTAVSPRTVRKWCAPVDCATHLPMPNNAWRLLLLLTGEMTPEAMRAALREAPPGPPLVP